MGMLIFKLPNFRFSFLVQIPYLNAIINTNALT